MSDSIAPGDSWFLTGPTASGKSQIGLELAKRLGAEIIALDSMSLYRGMDIGTAKPTTAEQATVPHHLIDILEPSESYSVAQYVAAASQVVTELRTRGREALFVGGTPLYLKTLLRGIFVGPAADWELRAKLAELAEREGAAALHNRLVEVDPASAARLHPSDTRRVIRALEFYEKTGRSISSEQQQFHRARPATDCRVFVLDWPRAQLYRRIEARVEQMFADGLVDEVRGLIADGKQLSHTASQALGYREVLEYLDGKITLERCVELVKTRTRNFAKRQLTWFRSLSECRFVPMTSEADAITVADHILALAEKERA
jgi:tRNA dimethylallyltransferase